MVRILKRIVSRERMFRHTGKRIPAVRALEHVAGYILKHKVGDDYQYLLDILKPYEQSVMAMRET